MSLNALVKDLMGVEATDEDIDVFKPEAERKLNFIIQRSGDADGIRRDPKYLAMLIGEMIIVERFFGIKKESTQHNVSMLPQTNMSVS